MPRGKFGANSIVHVVVFGASGFLGGEIILDLKKRGLTVSGLSRADTDVNGGEWAKRLNELGPIDGIVWAQGANSKGSVLDSDPNSLAELFEANVAFISRTLKKLFDEGSVAKPCRAVVLSSIWQEVSRQEKFDYTVTKSALAGLVNSITIDLAPQNFAINMILPGVVDSPMTRANLSMNSIEDFARNTPGGKLVDSSEIASTVAFLLSSESSGISGQSIIVDRGWSKVRYVND